MYKNNKRLKVINFFGGPGCGKSTTAAEVFATMKRKQYKVELVHEAAKELVWERAAHLFFEQDWIFAHQHRLIRRLVDHDIDYAVVDSPILLSLMYMEDDFPQSFRAYVRDTFDSYDNINIVLNRNPDISYIQTGRNQTQEQAEQLDEDIIAYLTCQGIEHYVVDVDDAMIDRIMYIIANRP